MAAPMKKRAVNLDDKSSAKNNKKKNGNNDDDGWDGEENMEDLKDEVIQVDFEGRNPIDSDFHGIKQLLSQLFLKAHLNLSELTNAIINQNYVGSVIKQSDIDGDESDDDDLDQAEVFGITTVLNLTEKQELECIQQLRNLLLELSSEHGSEEVVSLVKNLLSDGSKSVGLLINERFINIPAQIVVPMLKSLRSEIKRAVDKNMAFDFSYLILISKLYKADSNNKKRKQKGNKGSSENEIIWSNPEEEIIDQEADAKFEFSVEKESDSGLSGLWEESDEELVPLRRVLFISAHKLDDIIEKIEKEVSV